MLTAAVRDLHLTYPDQFVTDVRTSCPELWENNPHLTPLREDETGVEILDCEYPLIHKSNDAPFHFIHGFIDHLNEQLGLAVRPTVFRGDIHIAPIQKTWFSQVEEIVREPLPFWTWRAASTTSPSSGGTSGGSSGSSITSRIAFCSCRSARAATSIHHCRTSSTSAARRTSGSCSARGALPRHAADASRRGGRDTSRHAEEPSVRGRGRRARTTARGSLSASPVHPSRRGPGLLRWRRLLEVARGAPGRRQRKGRARTLLRRRRRCTAAVHGPDHGRRRHPVDRGLFRRWRRVIPLAPAAMARRPVCRMCILNGGRRNVRKVWIPPVSAVPTVRALSALPALSALSRAGRLLSTCGIRTVPAGGRNRTATYRDPGSRPRGTGAEFFDERRTEHCEFFERGGPGQFQ